MPATTAAYRSADLTLERFGAVLERHGHSKLAVLRSVAMAVGLSLVGVSALVSLVWQDVDPVDGLVAFVVGTVACTAAVAIVVRAFGSRGVQLELRERGLTLRARGRDVGMLWDDVVELRVSRRNVRRWLRDGCTLLAADGGRLALTDAVSGIAGVCSFIEGECAQRQLPRMLADLGAGRAVLFGPFALTTDGITHRDRRLTWKEVGGARVMTGLIVIGDATRGIRILPKGGGLIAWAMERYDEVPNAAVMLAVVSSRMKRLPSATLTQHATLESQSTPPDTPRT